jgi:hypothetical protein
MGLLRAHHISSGVKNLFTTYRAKALLVRTTYTYDILHESFVRKKRTHTMTILGLVLCRRLFAILTLRLVRLTS